MKKIIFFTILSFSGIATLAQFAAVTIPGSEIRKIMATGINQEYELHIFLPPGYEQGNKKYPVVYLMDGQWDFPLLTSIYGEQYFDGFIPALIVVGVTWGGANPNPDSLRARDYTPTNDKRLVQSGGAEKFLSFLQQDLFPFIENNYKADAQNRTLMGCSLGGLLTLYTLLTHPTMFTGYVAASPAVGWDNGVLDKYKKDFNETKTTTLLRVYLTVGEVEMNRPVYEKFTADLIKNRATGINIHSKVLENTGHSGTKTETYSRGLQYIFERPNLAPNDLQKRYEGVYLLPGNDTVTIKYQQRGLVLYFSPAKIYQLFAATENEFYATSAFLNLTFKKEGNKITGFQLDRYGSSAFVKKVK